MRKLATDQTARRAHEIAEYALLADAVDPAHGVLRTAVLARRGQ